MTPTEISDLVGAALVVLTALAGWLKVRTAQANAAVAQQSAQAAHARLNVIEQKGPQS